MVEFSLSAWLKDFPSRYFSKTRRKARKARIARIEGLEDRSLLTANLPVAVADTYNVNEDTTLTGTTVLVNDTDADGDTIDVAVLGTTTANGDLTLNADGTFTYEPDPDFFGVDTFTYFARDSANSENSATAATVTINVGAVDDLPVANAATIAVTEDVAINGTLTGTDADGDPLTFAAGAVDAANGTVVINADGTFTYTPDANFSGTDTFSFNVDDGTTTSADATITLNVSAVNDAPVATVTSIAATEDLVFTGTLAGTDAEGDPLTFAAGAIDAANGTVVINADGTFTYTPDANFNGTDSFSFNVDDGTDTSADATVSVTVGAVVDVPVATPLGFTINEDGTFSGTLAGTDADGDPLTFDAGTIDAANGTVVINADGTFTYTPDADFNGVDTFTFTVDDGLNTSTEAVVTANVTAVNDAPLTTPITITTAEDAAFSGTLTATDAEGDPITFDVGSVAATGGTVVINPDGTFTFTPTANFNGTGSFTFIADDGTDASADTVATVTITAVNDAPVVTNGAITVAEDNSFGGTLTGTDADGDTLQFTAGTVDAANGTVTINSNGSFTYTPDVDFNGTDTFSFIATDGTLNSTEATMTVTVTAVNDVPVGTTATVSATEDTAFTGTLTATDTEGDALTFAAGTTAAANGTVVINPNGSFTYTPNANFSGTDTFSFTASDGTGTSLNTNVTVNVAAVNDVPVATSVTLTTNEDTTLNGTLTGTDVEGSSLTFAAGAVAAANGTVVLNPNGTFTYTPNANFSGTDTFTFTVNDGTATSAAGTATINVTAVNDPPVATGANITTNEDAAFTGTLTATDAEGNPLTFAAGTTAAANGTVVINANGTYTYTPNLNFNGTDSFSFVANDGTSNSANATINVTVTALNDTPVANSQTITVGEDTPFSGTLTAVDADGNSLTFSAGTVAAQHGTVVINANGSFTYTPNANYSGPDAFSFKVNDGTINSADATVTVNVTGANDLPVATAQAITVTEDTAFTGTLTGTDVDGNPLTFSAGAVAAAHGTVVINPNGSFTYTPAANYTGSDTFSFKVNDGTGNSADANVTVTVTAVNDVPVVINGAGTLEQDATFNGSLSPLATDAEGNPLTFTAVTQPTNGTLTLNPDGTFVFTPNTGFNGTDSFTFQASDSQGNSNIGTFNLTITALFDLEASGNVGTIATSKKAIVPLDPTLNLANVSPTTSFANASISAGIIAGGDKHDQIRVTDGAGVDVKGKRVLFNGTEVARLSGGKRGQSLQVQFNGSATEAAVEAVLQRIGLKTTKNASRNTRTVQIQVNAGGGTSTTTVDATVA